MVRAATVVTLMLIACGGAQTPAPGVGEPLPALELALRDGGTWQPRPNRVLVVDVWATWCEPCAKGFPYLNELAANRPDVDVVAVSIDEDNDAVARYRTRVDIRVPIAVDPTQSLTRPPLAVSRVPTIIVVDRAGTVRHRFEEPADDVYRRLGPLVDALRR